MNALTASAAPPPDPSELSWPTTLPIELALKTASVKDICEGYGLDKAQYEALRANPLFIEQVASLAQELRKDKGLSFKLKAQLQSEELLKTSWKLIHSTNDQVPPNVKADLIKFTWKVAGLEPEKKDNKQVVVPLLINLNLA